MSPAVLEGAAPGLTVNDIQLRLADVLAQNPNSSRFNNMVLRWIQSTLLEIQLADTQRRRTTVFDADLTLIANTSDYDVRDTEANGGFGWDNCFEVINIILPDVSSRPLDPLNLQQYRNRSFEAGTSGPGYAWVMLDQFRLRIVPPPDQAYTGKGDYLQDIPKLTASGSRIDWPRAWDVVLEEGALFRGMRWKHQAQPSVWKSQEAVYKDTLEKMRSHERNDFRRPSKAVQTRNLRTRRIPRDNSTDLRGYRW